MDNSVKKFLILLFSILPIYSYAQTPEANDRWPIIRGWDGVAIRDIVDPATGAVKTTTVGGGSGDGAILDGVSGTIKATVRDYTNSNPLSCVLTDTNGDSYTAGGGTSFTDNNAFTGGTTTITNISALYDTTPPAITDGNAGIFRMGSDRILLVNGSNFNQPVTGTVTVTDGAGALNTIVDSGSLTCNAGTNLNTSALALDATLTGRFPNGSTPADNESNSVTVTRVGVLQYVFDGTTWDRWTGAVSGTVTANAGTGTFTTGDVPVTSGGTSISRTVSAASTNATNVKASAGQVYQVIASNVNAAARWVHLYNTSGTPTCNTSIIASFILPGNSTGAGNTITLNPGAAFGTGIGFCITTANDGTGSVSASDVVLNIFYK